MGYSTDWHGGLELSRSLTPAEQKEWDNIEENRHDSKHGYGDSKREYPSIWCNFEVQGRRFQWNGNEKTYEGYGWILYFLKTCKEWSMENDLVYATGEMIWEGEQSDDRGRVIVGYDTKTNLYEVEEEVGEISYTYTSNDRKKFKKGGKVRVKGRSWYEAGGMVKQAEKMRSFKNEMDNSIRKSKTEIEDSKRSIQKNRENLIDSAENIQREEKSIIDNMRGMREDAKEAQEFERRAKKYKHGGSVDYSTMEMVSNIDEKWESQADIQKDLIQLLQAQYEANGPEILRDWQETIEIIQIKLNILKNTDPNYYAKGGKIEEFVSIQLNLGAKIDTATKKKIKELTVPDGYDVRFINSGYSISVSGKEVVKTGNAEYAKANKLMTQIKDIITKNYAKGGEIYEYDYQDEVHKMVSDLTEEEYENFCSNYDIDPEDASQMQWFIGDLDEDDADEVMSEIRINIKYKERNYAKGGRTYSRENRPSPSDSATIFDIGYRSRGNDGNIWEIRENIKGTHRWVKLKG
tara:strand:+ start:1927 stop:3486 length:1560 start_codon:yes stop_codon:yes gene_type:complete